MQNKKCTISTLSIGLIIVAALILVFLPGQSWGAKPVDSDGDGILDKSDPCPDDARNDFDGDFICEGTGFNTPNIGDNDNCPDYPNTDQSDTDTDGVGNVCDVCPNDALDDSDDDGVCAGTGYLAPKTEDEDNCPDVANADQLDDDDDGYGDLCDPCPDEYANTCADQDEDGYSDTLESDSAGVTLPTEPRF